MKPMLLLTLVIASAGCSAGCASARSIPEEPARQDVDLREDRGVQRRAIEGEEERVVLNEAYDLLLRADESGAIDGTDLRSIRDFLPQLRAGGQPGLRRKAAALLRRVVVDGQPSSALRRDIEDLLPSLRGADLEGAIR